MISCVCRQRNQFHKLTLGNHMRGIPQMEQEHPQLHKKKYSIYHHQCARYMPKIHGWKAVSVTEE